MAYSCCQDRIVPFSCKGRGFCPSCGGRHVATYNNVGSNTGLFFNHADWLGTERVRTNASGTAFEWCDKPVASD